MIIRAALHIHSNWSYDGQWELPTLATAFAARGYRVLLMTEHDLGFSEERRLAHREACRELSTDHLLIIPGIEYSDASNTIHVLVWGDGPFLGIGQETQRMLEHASEYDGVCVLAHPSRRAAWRLFHGSWLKHLAAIEVWNRKTDGWSPSRDAWRLVSQTGASPIVGHDFHSAKQFFPMSTCLPMPDLLNETKVLQVLRTQSFSCQVFGVALKQFAGGLAAATTLLLESGRRLAARGYRLARPRLPFKPSLGPGSVVPPKGLASSRSGEGAEAAARGPRG